MYVFCVFTEQDRDKADPLDLDQWELYVLATRVIEERLGVQQTARLSTLQKIGAARGEFAGLKRAIEAVGGE